MIKKELLFYVIDKMGVQDGKIFIDLYNSKIEEYGLAFPRGYRPKVGDSWGAVFISAVMLALGVKDFPCEVGAQKLFDRFDPKYLSDKPSDSGLDIVGYDWYNKDWICHLGFAIHHTDSMVFSLEGNYSSTVGLRKISLNNSCIKKYINLGQWLVDHGYEV